MLKVRVASECAVLPRSSGHVVWLAWQAVATSHTPPPMSWLSLQVVVSERCNCCGRGGQCPRWSGLHPPDTAATARGVLLWPLCAIQYTGLSCNTELSLADRASHVSAPIARQPRRKGSARLFSGSALD
jgi:hypothetical protein